MIKVTSVILVASDELGHWLLNLAHYLAVLVIHVLLLERVINCWLLVAVAIIGIPGLLTLDVGGSPSWVKGGVDMLELDVLSSRCFR